MVVYRLAVFTMAASNMRYGRLYRSEDSQAFVDAHARFYGQAGGIPKCMVYDNMRVAIARFVGRSEKESTVELKQLSTYYGFGYRFCNIRRANEKGHVERSCEYVRRKAYSVESEFESEEAAQKRLSETVERLNGEKQDEVAKELSGMNPGMPPYTSIVRASGIVNKLSCISYKQNHYSVEDRLVGKEVEIQACIEEIVIRYEGDEVGRHRRSYESHAWTLDIMHYRGTLSRKPGALGSSVCLRQTCEWVRELYETHFRASAREFIQMLDLFDSHTQAQIEGAVRALTQAGARVQADSIRMILGNKPHEQQREENNEIEEACETQLRKYGEVGA